MALATGLLLANAAVVLFMVGLIWLVQLVHYPLFALVGNEGFARYEAEHQRRITWIVGPAIFVALVSSALLVFERPAGVAAALAVAGAVLVGVTTALTGLVQAPAHGRLGRGFAADELTWLVRTSWLRTAGWTAHGAVVLAMLGQALG